MRTVQFHAVEARCLRPLRRSDEGVAGVSDFIEAQGPGAEFVVDRRAVRCLSDQLPGRAHPGMVQLHNRMGAFRVQGCRQPREAGQVLVIKNAELAGKALSLRLHMCRAGHGQAKATLGPQGQPAELVTAEHAVSMALEVGEGRQHEAILQGRPAGKGQGGVKGGHLSMKPPRSRASISSAGAGRRAGVRSLTPLKYRRPAWPCGRGNPDSWWRSWQCHRR